MSWLVRVVLALGAVFWSCLGWSRNERGGQGSPSGADHNTSPPGARTETTYGADGQLSFGTPDRPTSSYDHPARFVQVTCVPAALRSRSETRVDGIWRELRLDFDPVKGPHFNLAIGKRHQGVKKFYPWPGAEADVSKVMKRNV